MESYNKLTLSKTVEKSPIRMFRPFRSCRSHETCLNMMKDFSKRRVFCCMMFYVHRCRQTTTLRSRSLKAKLVNRYLNVEL